jgi:hypothetical protein
MAALTFSEALVIIQSRAADSSDDTFATQALNQAQREVARERPWPENRVDGAFINTSAAYSTGTIVATLDSATVTLTDGVWPTDVATGKYRFALSASDPWYEVSIRDSDTVITLAQNYVQATATTKPYIVYKSHYDLATAVDRVEEMWLHDEGRMVPLINAATDEQVTEFVHYPSGPGTPTHFYSAARTAATRRVQFGSSTPDKVFRVEYTYFAKTTDGTLALDESRWPVILSRATAIMYEPEFFDRSLVEMQRYKQLLEAEWARTGETETQHVRVGQTRVRYPGLGDYHSNILGFGRVTGPS